MPQSFLCPITAEIMADPVSTLDGFSYEREAIAEWFASGQRTSPMTGAPLQREELVPNHALRAAIQQYVEEHPQVATDLYRPRGTDALRQTIGAKEWAPPQPSAPPPVASSDPEPGVPLGMPLAPQGSSYEPIQPPPPPPLTPLTAEDVAAAAPFEVRDWQEHCIHIQSSGRSSNRGGGSSWNPFSRGKASTRADSLGGSEPKARARDAEGGGVALEVSIDSEESLQRLALRLAAASSAPLSELRLTWADQLDDGPLKEPMHLDESSAFALLARALRSGSERTGASACLAGLRALSISKLIVGHHAAQVLSAALQGHPKLNSLELWNVALEDEGALHIAQLAAHGSPGVLTELNLGRNLISGEAREQLERIVDATRVHAKMY